MCQAPVDLLSPNSLLAIRPWHQVEELFVTSSTDSCFVKPWMVVYLLLPRPAFCQCPRSLPVNLNVDDCYYVQLPILMVYPWFDLDRMALSSDVPTDLLHDLIMSLNLLVVSDVATLENVGK